MESWNWGLSVPATENVHKIWLKSPTGQEEHFDLSQTGVELREGHEILVVSGGDVTGTKIVNHASSQPNHK